MVKRVDVCTFGFLYSAGQVARPVDGPGRIPKAKSAKNERNQPGLPSVVMMTLWGAAAGGECLSAMSTHVGATYTNLSNIVSRKVSASAYP